MTEPIVHLLLQKYVQKGSVYLESDSPVSYVRQTGQYVTCDTVHEMARDEARHGKAFKGLLERYFGK